jgi:hypothetical protein
MYFPMTSDWGRLIRPTLACSGRGTGTQEPVPFPPPDRTLLRAIVVSGGGLTLKMSSGRKLRVGSR